MHNLEFGSTRRFLDNTNINRKGKKTRKYREAEDLRHMTSSVKFNPIINVYIYEVASNTLPNLSTFNSNTIGQQKFENLYYDTKSKGIIYPINYNYYSPRPSEFSPDRLNPAHRRHHVFNITQVENDGRLYTSDILSSVPQQGGSINNLKDFYYFYKSHRTKKVDFINEIRVIGGEPFLNKEIYSILSHISDIKKINIF